jgi:hypothetical protein
VIESSDELRNRIRDLGESEPDPHRVAEKILARMDDYEAQVIARLTLPDYVRKVLAQARPLDTENSDRSYYTASGRRTPSSKVAAVHDWVEADLARSIYVDDTENYKHLGDCTAENLDFAGATRRRKAAETIAEADRFDRMAAAVRDAGVEILREVPRPVLEQVLARS